MLFLNDLYTKKGLSAAQIAKEFSSSKSSVLKALRHFEIPIGGYIFIAADILRLAIVKEGLKKKHLLSSKKNALQIKETKTGSLKHQWVKTYQANEALDTLTNNLGLHTILFANYSEDRWKGLERS